MVLRLELASRRWDGRPREREDRWSSEGDGRSHEGKQMTELDC